MQLNVQHKRPHYHLPHYHLPKPYMICYGHNLNHCASLYTQRRLAGSTLAETPFPVNSVLSALFGVTRLSSLGSFRRTSDYARELPLPYLHAARLLVLPGHFFGD
jgi:hypothetical protein